MRLSLTQMAQRLGFTPKTFAKHVTRDKIPHLVIGRAKRFDPIAVEAHLAVKWEAKPVARRANVVRKSRNKFGEALGL